MDAKLTLKLDKSVIDRAKNYASLHNRSLSRLIESYLQSLVEKDESLSDENEISPFVKSMKSGVSLPVDSDDRNVYRDHLAEKYK